MGPGRSCPGLPCASATEEVRQLLVLATSCMRKKQKKRNDDEAHPGTGTTSGHSRRRMQPNQKHNDNANRVLAVNFNHRRNPKKKQQEAHTHSTLLSVDMLPKIAHACSFWGLEKGLDFG